MQKLMTALAVASLTVPVVAQSADQAAVQQAALNYVTAVYEGKPDLIRESVSPELVKFGYMRQRDGSYRTGQMTFDQLLEVAKAWNANGQRDTSVKAVEVYDVLDQTASAKVTASWGSDYLLLAKIDGVWKIRQIVWQTPPPGR
jgi:hypothetical protein